MIFGKNRAFLYPTKVLADTNNSEYLLTITYPLRTLP